MGPLRVPKDPYGPICAQVGPKWGPKWAQSEPKWIQVCPSGPKVGQN